MPLEPGSKLGPYNIVAALAAEEEVYKASDSQRNRTVTIKLLPAAISQNVSLSQRVERETRVVTALNHPHIGAIYDVGRQDDTGYIVAEYLEGETLAERLSRGPLDLEVALKTALALADALDKAHRQGVAHRNLTPSRIVFTESGVKLLDFGLTEVAVASNSPVSISVASTRTMPSAATAVPTSAMPYLSPEQIEGREGDARSDLFALGAILFEMVTGRRAFEGKTQALLIAAIQTIDPDPVSKFQPLAPPTLDFVVQRCLTKDPKKRLPSTWDLLCQLEWILTGGGEGGAFVDEAANKRKRDRLYRIALAAASLVALALVPVAYLYMQGSAPPLEARFVLSDLGFNQVGGAGRPTLSPDGRWLVTSRLAADGGAEALSLDSVTKQILAPSSATYNVFFKPDSKEVAFFDIDEKLKTASILGGQPRIICDAATPYGGGSWGSKGDIVFSGGGLLYRVRDVGGDKVAISKLDTAQQESEHVGPFFLPDGEHYLYLAVSSDPSKSAVYVASLNSPDRTRLFESESQAVYADPGYILFNRGDVLYAWTFDAKKLAMRGEPVRLADGVPAIGGGNNKFTPTSMRGSASFGVSQTGVLAYRTGGAPSGRGNTAGSGSDGAPLTFVMGGEGRSAPASVGPSGTYAGVSLAPDGRRFAVHRHEGTGGDIWLYDPGQSGLQRWTFDPSQENSSPVWSPDGKRIAFASRRNGKWGIYIKAADLTGTEERVVEIDLPLAPMSWAQPEELVYWVDDPKTLGDIWSVPLTGDHKAVPVLQTSALELFPQVSGDGKWIAYQAPDAMGNPQIWVNSYPKKQGAGWQITNDGGVWPRWRTDGKAMELYYYFPPTMMSVTLRVVGAGIQWDAPQVLFGINNPNLVGSSHSSLQGSYYRYAVSDDGHRFLIPQPTATAPATRGGAPVGGMLADQVISFVDGRGGRGAGGAANEIAIVLNWPRLLKTQ